MRFRLITNLLFLLFFTISVLINAEEEVVEEEPPKVEDDIVGDVDYSASTVDLRRLVYMEQKILTLMVQYKLKAEKKLGLIRDFLLDYASNMETQELKRIQEVAKIALSVNSETPESPVGPEVNLTEKMNLEDLFPLIKESGLSDVMADDLVKHPLKAYKLIARFYYKFPGIEKALSEPPESEEFIKSLDEIKSELPLPNEEAMSGLIDSIIRLQLTYNLDVDKLVKGQLKNFPSQASLTARDCFDIGQHALNKEIYTTAIEFLLQSLALVRKDPSLQNRLEEVEAMLDDAIQKHDKTLQNWDDTESDIFKTQIFSHYKRPIKYDLGQRTKIELTHSLRNLSDVLGTSAAFIKLCNGEELREPKEYANLKCYSYSKSSPYFTIAPLKMEVVSNIPPIIQFYEVFTDKQLDKILERAAPQIKRAMVQSLEGKEGGEKSGLRASSSTWIYDQQLEEIKEEFGFVGKTIEAITGLECTNYKSTEDLQIANYPPGGFYTSHFDNVHEPILMHTLSEFEMEMGDRISTFMIYLSDIELGGGTVFPMIGVKAKPVRGSAIFWYNLHKDNSINRNSLHGGCPVLLGEKWVANKWIRMHAQAFKRKCPKDAMDSIEHDIKSIGFDLDI